MRKIALSLMLVFSLTAAGSAEYKMGTDAPVKSSKKKKSSDAKMPPFPSTPHVDPEAAVLKELSENFSVPVEKLNYYRSLNYGFEELVPALVVARDAQIEEGRALKMRSEGKTWAQVYDFFSLDSKKVQTELSGILEPIRGRVSVQAMKGKPATH